MTLTGEMRSLEAHGVEPGSRRGIGHRFRRFLLEYADGLRGDHTLGVADIRAVAGVPDSRLAPGPAQLEARDAWNGDGHRKGGKGDSPSG